MCNIDAARRQRSDVSLWRRIEALDLSLMTLKLARTFPKLTDEDCRVVEEEYRRFLYLSLQHEGATIVPVDIVDEFWHFHILDTAKYARDCIAQFGSLLHHFPYLGLRGPADEENLVAAFGDTKAIYRREFGEDLMGRLRGIRERAADYGFDLSAGHSTCSIAAISSDNAVHAT